MSFETLRTLPLAAQAKALEGFVERLEFGS